MPLAAFHVFFSTIRPPPTSTLFPYTTLFRSSGRSLTTAPINSPPFDPPSIARPCGEAICWAFRRSEEHTSELQSLRHLVCRLLLEKKKRNLGLPESGCRFCARYFVDLVRCRR